MFSRTHDNIAAYWVPQRAATPGAPLELAWRLHWTLGDPPSDGRAWVTQTRRGHGYRKEKIAANRLQFHVDFAGPALPEPADAAALEVLASGNANVRALRTNAYPNTVRGGWRVSVDLERIDAARPVELRLQLRRAGKVISETWSYALAPE
jgi:glucans biosynthesis protein